MKNLRWVSAALLVLGFALPGAVFTAEFISVDSCLDRGGSFNYSTGACDFAHSHPYAPFLPRHRGTVTAGAGLIVAAVAGFFKAGGRRHHPEPERTPSS
jgi:hypothetical protein